MYEAIVVVLAAPALYGVGLFWTRVSIGAYRGSRRLYLHYVSKG